MALSRTRSLIRLKRPSRRPTGITSVSLPKPTFVTLSRSQSRWPGRPGPAWPPRARLAAPGFLAEDPDECLAFETRTRTIHDLDLANGPGIAFQVDRPCFPALADELAHRQGIALSVCVDDLQIKDLDVVVPHTQLDGAEAAFRTADPDHVAIDQKPDPLFAQKLLISGPGRRIAGRKQPNKRQVKNHDEDTGHELTPFMLLC
jgi:hypothetical protein